MELGRSRVAARFTLTVCLLTACLVCLASGCGTTDQSGVYELGGGSEPLPAMFRGPYAGEVGPDEVACRWAACTDEESIVFDPASGTVFLADSRIAHADFPFAVKAHLVTPDGERRTLSWLLDGRPVSFSSSGRSAAVLSYRLTGKRYGPYEVYDGLILTLRWFDDSGTLLFEQERQYSRQASKVLDPGLCRVLDDGRMLLAVLPPDGWEPGDRPLWETLLVDRHPRCPPMARSSSTSRRAMPARPV